ncbi:hypothetical protein SAMN04487982_11949 [Streptomyces sp. ok210]|jgi:hypothetical protein|nr:hypothetical protein SAMN04487982_11949 [Streptomyces sp. ok210]
MCPSCVWRWVCWTGRLSRGGSAGDRGECGLRPQVSFRITLEERGWSYVMTVDPEEIARPVTAGPHQPDYSGLSRRHCPATASPPEPLRDLICR